MKNVLVLAANCGNLSSFPRIISRIIQPLSYKISGKRKSHEEANIGNILYKRSKAQIVDLFQ
jgi:hypothetical protein